MEVTFTVPALKAALRRVLPAVPKKTSRMVTLNNLLVSVNAGAITLRATNLDLDLVVGVSGRADSDGKMVVAARTLSRFVNACEKTARVVVRDEPVGPGIPKAVIIEADSVSVHTRPGSVKDFPNPPTLSRPTIQNVDFDAIRLVLPAAATDQSRPVLCGVRVEGDHTVATDTYRLFDVVGSTTVRRPLTIPHAPAVILTKIGGVHQVAADDRRLMFQAEGFTLRATMSTGEYPPWESILPEAAVPVITFEEEGFVRQISRLATLAKGMRDGDHNAAMGFTGSNPLRVLIKSTSGEQIRAVFRGSTTKTIAFNCRYLHETLRGADIDTLHGGKGHALVARWEADGYKHTRVLMPVRTLGAP